ncbi:flagellar basal body P-ring biosynthesis protein FlgA [Rhizobium sp. LC145]|jgi:predicted homoserine dehydrogenase-like protein|uniref:flagellar basal body P-ring biosynthesis protein FlgA n=1 Tax=Rhizobium sp. LC145 TaxID=1120688 RepID=UPI000629F64D|nr:flagellar basal body P-ring biosynthesis protein FlgA [Rhizobium sp. LC145]KKX32972.1 flagellar basal body P-ring biosynthesis protein FlgA [Rhizobium sp. LC145]TKT57383.1 flagellar biosynthesis protein FlgA [Rhizobiaceae bacterium LC148]
MYRHALYPASGKASVCLVGTGAFGRSLLAHRVPRLDIRIAVDMDPTRAAAALRAAGIPDARISICENAEKAARAFADGRTIAAGDLAHVIDLPFDLLVEATGDPEAGARHTDMAVSNGRHVALVSKEVDSVVGPGLAHIAAERGVVVTPVDGDQPSLLIDLVTWAELLGFEIVAAGKASEYDFVFDPATATLTSNGETISVPEFSHLLDLGNADIETLIAARARAAAALPQRAVPDLCEMGVVSHSIDLFPDRPDFHCPIARITEVPTIFSTRDEGGILGGDRRLDVFHCLRLPGEVSFAGGVFVVVRCRDAESWKMLAEKGHILSRTGDTAMIYLPRHLLGLEAATSILDAVLLKRSSGAPDPKPRLDLIAVAETDLPAGTLLSATGHHHAIENVGSALIPAAPLAADAPAPFYLVANRKLAKPVREGEAIALSHLELDPNSHLLRLRKQQDAIFLTFSLG